MSNKRIRCFTYSLKNKGVKCDSEFIKNVTEELFKTKDVKIVDKTNRAFIYKGQDDEHYLSLEYIKQIDGLKINDNYIFFRIGREKDIEGALKRNLKTFEGKEIIGLDEQDSYNLEICTYILIDIVNGIILELYGRYAPSVKWLCYIFNNCFKEIGGKFENISLEYKNILTEKLIDELVDNGNRLGKVKYSFERPNIEFLQKLGLDPVQIQAVKDLDLYEVDVILKGKGNVPLTKSTQKIRHFIYEVKKSPQYIKDKIKITGKTGNSSSKDYTFKEEEVTYIVDISNIKVIDNKVYRLTLDDICKEAYSKIELIYNEKKEHILGYIGK